jgi:hypothetical protein
VTLCPQVPAPTRTSPPGTLSPVRTSTPTTPPGSWLGKDSGPSGGKAAKHAVGGYTGGRPPFGWRAEGKELVPDEREQAVITLARRLAQEGMSSRQIAGRLEEAGHRPKVGERWSSVQVGRVLRERR